MQLQRKERREALSHYLTVEDVQPCVVEYVNTAHRWYMVRFDKTGLRQCYKLPQIKGEGTE